MRRETIHCMTRRRDGWDYCAPGRYMVTLSLADRTRPWLGTLRLGKPEPPSPGASTPGIVPPSPGVPAPGIVPPSLLGGLFPTPLGTLVAAKWRELPALFPGVEVEEFVVMPDHLHGILRLATRQKHPLGQIVGAFKVRSTSAARMELQAPASSGASTPGTVPPGLLDGASLWSPGLTDSILYSEERRLRAVAYIADNVRRLVEKRLHPELFTVRRDLEIPLPLGPGGAMITAHFSAIGNASLLQRLDFHQVQCSRRFFAYRRDRYGNPLPDEPPALETPEFALTSELASTMAEAGAVVVCPCISHGEREIARRLYKTSAAMIVLRNKGFAPLYKPEGALFDHCAEGSLLMLAPAAWPFMPGRKDMTRDDACALNRIAQAIAGEGAAEINYHGMLPADIDQIARTAIQAH